MLSSLVHAGLVWREEYVIKRALNDDDLLQAAAEVVESRREVTQTSERTPLLDNQSLLGQSSRGRSFGGGSRA